MLYLWVFETSSVPSLPESVGSSHMGSTVALYQSRKLKIAITQHWTAVWRQCTESNLSGRVGGGGGVVLEILQAGFLSGARHTDHSIRSAGLSHRWCYLNSGLSVLHCPEKVPSTRVRRHWSELRGKPVPSQRCVRQVGGLSPGLSYPSGFCIWYLFGLFYPSGFCIWYLFVRFVTGIEDKGRDN